MTSEESRERRVRYMADRQGLVLKKSRRRDPRALDYGGHWLITRKGTVKVGGKHGTTLEALEAYLTGEGR